ncbi:MAG TPA: TolC family protein [Thermoanaerobaculia bacterium]|jgi:outer membrane protein TolC|nr:TolC family protein [Thermoanaerobaculia bacterium]
MHHDRRTPGELSGSPRRARRRRAVLGGILALLAPAAAAAAAGQPPPTPLATLVAELEQRNPQILAAQQAWKAASQVPSQVATLPDPQLNLQQVSVGSPVPFAGYTTSEFAYAGIGISQDLPYPGKLRLRGKIAEREAAAAADRAEAVRRAAVEQLKVTYFRLAYREQTLGILEQEGALLAEIAEIAGARYRVGQGNQQDVLRAQLERTKLLREIEMHHREAASLEARLKQLLDRPPASPDLATEPLGETALPAGEGDLVAGAPAQNPEVAGAQEAARKQSLQVDLARKDFYPDFNLQYMWQRTDPARFRAYYMVTLGVRLPLYRLRRQQPELVQSVAELERSQRDYEAAVQQAYFDVRDQLAAAGSASRLLAIYRGGLLPQAAAAFEAGLAAYRVGRQDLTTLLASLSDLLKLDVEYWNTLADHETALARLERLRGGTLQ